MPNGTTTRTEAGRLIERLLAERPSFHGHAEVEPVNWQLGDRLLQWLLAELPDAPSTLETGCGYSTVLFAAVSAEHTVISPIAAEHERVQEWCAANDIATDHVNFVAQPSQWWLPGAAAAKELSELDLVLVDGDHAVPMPAIDWYYTAGALKVGGVSIIDDVAIRACGDLADFLRKETGRWQELATVADATAFRKLVSDVVEYHPWNQQPWNTRNAGLTGVLSDLRGKVRLRSRLRAVTSRRA